MKLSDNIRFYKRNFTYFAGEVEGHNIRDVGVINTCYPARECERIEVQEIKDWILFDDGDIVAMNSPDRMRKIKTGKEIRYMGDITYCEKLKKRLIS